jgi:Rod binding domain-containing protein
MSLPPIDQSQLPADIRSAAPARKDAYEAGLGFEQLLVQQLSRSLTDSPRDAMGGDSPYASLLPDALTDGLMSGGGLGLARQIADGIQPASRQDPPATAIEPTP